MTIQKDDSSVSTSKLTMFIKSQPVIKFSVEDAPPVTESKLTNVNKIMEHSRTREENQALKTRLKLYVVAGSVVSFCATLFAICKADETIRSTLASLKAWK
jgi:hypothetical protein